MTDIDGAKKIKAFLYYLADSEQAYSWSLEKMQEEDKRSQNYLHQLELETTRYTDRAKIATQLAKNRKDRRYYKDMVEELEPIHEFMEASKTTINLLKQTLGVVRKAERYHSNRTYKPKYEVMLVKSE